MLFTYLAVSVILYILLRCTQMIVNGKENLYVRAFAVVCLVASMFMFWNIIAENRFRIEDWRDYDKTPIMEPSSGDKTIKELGIPDDGDIIKK